MKRIVLQNDVFLFICLLFFAIGGHSFPSSPLIPPNVKPITSTSTTLVSSGEIPPSVSPSPYEELYSDEKLSRIRLSIERYINRTSSIAGPLIQGLLSYDPHTAATTTNNTDPLEFCQSYIKQYMGGSRIRSDHKGCEFEVSCDYDKDRFPAFLLQGVCLKSYCGGGLQDSLTQPCRIYKERMPILQYKRAPADIGQYGGMESEGTWSREIVFFNADCNCSIN